MRCRSSGSLIRWWESNQKPSRHTCAVFIRTSASLLVCNPQEKTPAHNLSWLVLRRVMNTGHCTSKRINIDRRMGRIQDMHIRMSSSTITHMNNDGLLARHTEHSATVTRTRVARVGAEYPNQLHYSAAGLRSNNMLAICVTTPETQSKDTFENKQSSLCVYLCVCVVCVWCASLFDCLSVQLSACWSLQHWFVDIIQYTHTLQPAAWSNGMILASGPRGSGFNSRSSPCDGET